MLPAAARFPGDPLPSVVVPAYDESVTLRELLSRVLATSRRARINGWRVPVRRPEGRFDLPWSLSPVAMGRRPGGG